MPSTISITTPQQVYIEYELATLGERFAAKAIDLLLFFIAYFISLSLFFYLTGAALNTGWIALIVFVFLPIFSLLFYHFFFELFKNGQTPGKMLLSLRVVPLDKWEPGLSHYALRAVFLIPDFFMSMGIFGALLISGSSLKQRMGDVAAHTAVIRLKTQRSFTLKNILEINQKKIEKTAYPLLKELSDKDMIIVKETLNRYRLYNNKAHHIALQQLCEKMAKLLQTEPPKPKDREKFLKRILKEYILITR